MAHMTGANTTPLGRLHPILAGKQTPSTAEMVMEKPGIKRAFDNKPDQIRIEEISRMLRTGDLGIPENPEDRSPSPEPIYNTEGKRLNTRDFRVRKRLEEERHLKIQEALKLNPEFKPPSDYKPPLIKIQDKVMIPQDENPEVNFIGLLIGPRLVLQIYSSNAKIMIRGKGSIKDGKVWQKGGSNNQQNSGEDEELHALVTGPTHESVVKAVAMRFVAANALQIDLKDVLGCELSSTTIRPCTSRCRGQNDLKRMQLRELAALNGTLREDELLSRCRNCGASNHRHWECPEQRNVTNSVICSKCGSAGHLANDCVQEE
ncbi:hypothetical protein QZH41_010286 [Actinostola sp. cb2023]|nr:hypothetical protein QZH41_010286 [Actinostola sp. cb2023]